ncbi:MAG: RNA methyltransferase [Gemmatimonadaceae bacterium]
MAEGIRLVEEILRSSFTIRGAIVSPELLATPRGVALHARLENSAIELLEVTDRDLFTASDTDTPQGILAISWIPTVSLSKLTASDSLRLLVLDAVQDPGNVGTMVRTAAGLGVTATVSLPGTVDLWSAKVVRSGMGAHFQHQCIDATWDELDAFRRNRSLEVWAADAGGELVDGLQPPAKLALVVGNEGAGLSAQARTCASRIVALSMDANAVESLNVAVATGILLYELR